MRARYFTLWLAFGCMGCFGGAMAQGVPAPAPVQAPALQKERPDSRIEHIRIEDSGAIIEELRYGGETESISVKPKMNAPQYEVQPNDGVRSSSGSRFPAPGTTGQRVWKVFTF